ncbi:MAG: rod shape-determining protein MreC [Verrucomicrobiota bacterium]
MFRPAYFICGVIVLLIAILGYFLPEEYKRNIEQVSTNLFSPIWRSVGWVKETTGDVVGDVKTLEQLQMENAQLRQENAKLMTHHSQLSAVQIENTRLKEMLGFKQSKPYELLACRVIERDPSNWWNVIIVNRGFRDSPDIASDQPVVSPRGVIGKTGAVGPYTTKVILLIDENCKVSVVTENSRARGIVQGATSVNGGDPYCKINFVDRNTPFSVGERLFTTGLGGTFPANLLIGTISEAPPLSAERNFGLFRDGKVQPTADLNNLEELFIVTGVK